MSTSHPTQTRPEPGWPDHCLLGGSLSWMLAESLRALAGRMPDTSGLEVWVAAHLAALRGANELTMLTLVLVLTGLIGRVEPLRRPAGLAWALGIAGALIGSASLLLLVAVEGRLVYPIPGLPLDVTTLPLVASLVLGARHLVALGGALSTGAFTIHVLQGSMKPSPLLATVGGLGVASQLAASFPWLCPPWVPMAASLLLATWTLLTLRECRGL